MVMVFNKANALIIQFANVPYTSYRCKRWEKIYSKQNCILDARVAVSRELTWLFARKALDSRIGAANWPVVGVNLFV